MGKTRTNRSLDMLKNTNLNPPIKEGENTPIQEPTNTEIQEVKNTEIQEPKNTDIQEDKSTEIQEPPKEKDWSKRSYNLKNEVIKKLEELKVFVYPVGTELQTIVEEAIIKLYEEKKRVD